MDFYLRRLEQVIGAAIAGMSPDQLSAHSEGKWCPAEILEHLYLTYTGTVKGCQRSLEAGKPLATAPTWKQRVGAFAVLGLSYLPEGQKSPERALPRGVDPQKVLDEICPQVALMDELLRRCEQNYGTSTKLMNHPILGPLTAQEWRKFHWIHGNHHLKQIERLRTLHR